MAPTHIGPKNPLPEWVFARLATNHKKPRTIVRGACDPDWTLFKPILIGFEISIRIKCIIF